MHFNFRKLRDCFMSFTTIIITLKYLILKKYLLNTLNNFLWQHHRPLIIKYSKLINYKFFSQTTEMSVGTKLNIKYAQLSKLSTVLKLLIRSKLKFTSPKSLLNYYSIFHLQEYFSMIFYYSFYFRATNLINLIKRYYKIIRYQLRVTKTHKKLKFIYPKDIYNLFFCSFMFKDIFLIQTWIKKQFERKSIKIYKSLIYTIWFLIKKFGWQYKQYNKLKSLFLSFKGKLIKGGSRKKLMLFTLGKLKSTSKINKFISTSFVLRTISGSVSCRLYYTF